VENVGKKLTPAGGDLAPAGVDMRRVLWAKLRKTLGLLRTFHHNFVEGKWQIPKKKRIRRFYLKQLPLLTLTTSMIELMICNSGTYELRLSFHEDRVVAQWICAVIGSIDKGFGLVFFLVQGVSACVCYKSHLPLMH
jgi:hypothetical protein